MTPLDRNLIAELCASRAGLSVDPAKAYLIETRLSATARREGLASVEALLAILRERDEDPLVWSVVEAMANAESSFFRDRSEFERFRRDLLPHLRARRGDGPIRVWSAGCGSGQEIYSLAMIFEEEAARCPGLGVELIGSDLSQRLLEKAKSGLYSQFEVQRGLPVRQLVRHFEKIDEMWSISPRLRQSVQWRRLNLTGEFTPPGRFDVIFCRYVLSGLIEPAKRRVLEKLARCLDPEGYLVLGNEEAGVHPSDIFSPAPGYPGVYIPDRQLRAAA